jgi:NAD+ synthase (glutamine-hydrolysing)
LRIGLGQFNATVGDLDGNVEKMRRVWIQAVEAEVDLLVFPELAVCGYPPEDLMHKQHFLVDNRLAVEKLAAACPKKTIVVGFAEGTQNGTYNAAAILKKGKISKVYRKSLLPNFSVFDEKRYFDVGTEPVVINVRDIRIAITICFDLWNMAWLKALLREVGRVDMILNISASPFHVGKLTTRQGLISQCASEFSCVVSYCNLVGGQDELVFDGRSMIADSGGRIAAQANGFEEDLLIADIERTDEGKVKVKPTCECAPRSVSKLEEIHKALLLGTRDYVRKNGFKKTLVGISGGIDSAVTAVIAVEALGAENVLCITMPTRFNRPETIKDAKKVAENLGTEFLTIPIESILSRFNESLKAVLGWDDKGIAYENLQARIRGTILMSLSNQFGTLVLTTGNKSEISVGYSTLYGDTAGGFAVLKDVLKTTVFELAEYINVITGKQLIPDDVITRPPSAELRTGQKDTDTLPDYELLDEIIKGYVEQDKSAKELVDSGLDRKVVYKVIRMVDRNEYKRRQSPPGVRITPKGFGKDRRLPITNRYIPDLI